jgi:hypothetical protein
MLITSMSDKICRYCEKPFLPSRYRPDQQVCSLDDCQRHRRADYHRQKLAEDSVYREQCRDSQAKWRAKNPDYMERYRARHRHRSQTAAKTRLLQELRRLLKHVENNVAQNLKSYDTRVWLLFPNAGAREKNSPDRPEVLVLPAFFYGLPLGADVKNIALKTR